MSKAKNHVDWCLRKAEKEGVKHRGLVITRPNRRLALEHIVKAEHNLTVFRKNKELGFFDWTISMGFYVLYHCCLAVLAEFGYESRNQECTFSVVKLLIEEKKISSEFQRYLDALLTHEATESEILPMREKYQYTTATDIDEIKVKELLALCQDMIIDTRGTVE